MRFFIIILFAIYFSPALYGQKVAVVLSGGGAKGLAHIGVLKCLEEQGIPIDYIAGTSMGAIIGGFYAAGYSPAEIEKITQSRDFHGWIDGNPGDDYNKWFFSRPADAEIFTVGLGVDQSLTPRFAANFVNDAVINFILARYLAKASAEAENDFNDLFVPYRAVAAEIFTQAEVILDSGDLHEAVRASMAIPFLYRPIRSRNNQLLFDGGIYNNFPVDVALEAFRPDVVIGVNVTNQVFDEYPYEQDEELISNKLFENLLNKSDLSKLRSQDISISPNLAGIPVTNFDYPQQVIDSGYIAALRKTDEISGKIHRRADREEVTARREEFTAREKPLLFKSIQFRGFNSNQMTFMRNVFQVHKKSMHSIEEVQNGYFRLISNEFFKDLYPRITYNQLDSSFVLEIQNKYDKSIKLGFGGFMTSRNIGELFLGVRFNGFNRVLAEHQLQLYTGRFNQSAHYTSRFILPTRHMMYIEPEVLFNDWDYIEISDLFKKEEPKNKFARQEDFKTGINMAWPAGSKYKLQLSGFYINNTDRYSNHNDINSSDILDKTTFEGMRTGILFSRNSLNRKQYADEGFCFDLHIDYFSGMERYTPGTTSVSTIPGNTSHRWTRFGVYLDRYFDLGSKFSGGITFRGLLSNQPVFSNYTSTILNAPAFYPLNDSRMLILDDFRSFDFGAGGLKIIYHVTGRADLRAEGYIFQSLHEITEGTDQKPVIREFDWDPKNAATVSVIYHSPAGPISLGLNYYSDPDFGLGVFFHLGYLIFKERSLD